LAIELQIGEQINDHIHSLLKVAGVPVIARIDVVDMNSIHKIEGTEGEAIEIDEPGVVEVNDHKTTSSIESYAKTADELASTHQMTLYGEFLRILEAKHIRLSHTVFQTRGARQASKRSKVLSADEIEKACRKSEGVVEWMHSVVGIKKISDVPMNLDACSAFGGCAFRNVCPRNELVVLTGIKDRLDKARIGERTSMGLITDRLQQKKNPEVESAKQELLQEEAQILPPDVPAPQAVAVVPEVEENPTTCQSEKKVRTKDKKYVCPCGAILKIKPTKLEDGQSYAFVPKHAPPELPIEPKDPTVGFVLLLDCIEDGQRLYRLEDYANAKAKDLARELNDGKDIRCVSNDHPVLSFSRWKGVLAAKIQEEPPTSGYWIVSSSSEIGMVAFEALASVAKRVVRGVR
jgi:hypothetical protein